MEEIIKKREIVKLRVTSIFVGVFLETVLCLFASFAYMRLSVIFLNTLFGMFFIPIAIAFLFQVENEATSPCTRKETIDIVSRYMFYATIPVFCISAIILLFSKIPW